MTTATKDRLFEITDIISPVEKDAIKILSWRLLKWWPNDLKPESVVEHFVKELRRNGFKVVRTME